MSIVMKCPGCKTAFEFPANLAGKRIKCKSCGEIFRIDEPAEEPAERPTPSRRPAASRRRDEEEERPSRRRVPVKNDLDDDPPRRARRDEDEEDDEQPTKRKIHPLVIVGPIAGVLVLGVVLAIVLLKGKGKKGPADTASVMQASAKTCKLEVAESEISTLVVPDSGTRFGILRKLDTTRKTWQFDPYDMATSRRTGRVDLSDVDEPLSVSMTPDGKYLMIVEGPAGGRQPVVSLWSILENKPLSARKWNPYPPPAKGGFNVPRLYRAEFAGNDRVVTLSTSRVMDVWPLPNFDPPIISGAVYAGVGDPLGERDHFGQAKNEKFQREAAFSADRKTMALWNGNGFTFVNLQDGQETIRTTSAVALAKELWAGQPLPDRVKGGPLAFSPDGKTLAAILTRDFGQKDHALCLWSTTEQTPPVVYALASNQLNEAPGLFWWGNRFVVTHGAMTDGILVDIKTGIARRQLMAPDLGRHTFGRDGRLWFSASEDRTEMSTVHVVDALDPDKLTEPDDYEQIVELNQEYFLRRIWLEPVGISREPLRYNPPLTKRLIRRP